MTAKHTPGPWMVEIDNRTDANGLYYVAGYNIQSACDGEVVGVEGICCGQNDEANARLIAAAPELLEACKRAIRYADNVSMCEGVTLDYHDDLPFIKAVIAKAEGRE